MDDRATGYERVDWPGSPLSLALGDGEGLLVGKVSDLYDMVHPEADPTITVRSVFVIDPAKKVRLILTYPPSTGRNFDEIIRSIDSLQLTDAHKVATPVNWTNGDPVIILPSLSDEAAKERFPGGWKTLKPYLRMVDQPKLPHEA